MLLDLLQLKLSKEDQMLKDHLMIEIQFTFYEKIKIFKDKEIYN